MSENEGDLQPASPVRGGDPEDSNDEEEEDKKPAAIEIDDEHEDGRSSGEEEDEQGNDVDERAGSSSEDDDSSSSDEDNSSDEEQETTGATSEATATKRTTEDGHELSEYELLRLERIRRNKEYLASLGLEKAKPQPKQTSTNKPRGRPKKSQEPIQRIERSALSRNSKKKVVSYAEKSVKGEGKQAASKKDKPSVARPKPPGESRMQARLDLFIYREFKRLEADTKFNLKLAEKQIRAAAIEQKYYQKKAEVFQKKERKRLEYLEIRQQYEEERALFGCYKSELARDIDRRSSQIHWELRQFDEYVQNRQSAQHRQIQHEQTLKKMEMIDALNRFPRSLKAATRDLDLLLVERAPKDPPAPRRGTRKRKTIMEGFKEEEDDADGDDNQDDAELGSPVAKKPKTSLDGLAAALTAESLSSSANVASDSSPPPPPPAANLNLSAADEGSATAAGRPKKKREASIKNVGGWVSPAFAKAIDRSWLERDQPEKKWTHHKYIPQIGDTVLYYPVAHRSFLKAHPDVLGRKTRQLLRLPLWERAAKEKRKAAQKKAHAAENGTIDGNEKQKGKSDAPRWWTEEWLSSVEGIMGTYPILCRVERTHAEFPPDPDLDNRIVKQDNDGNVQVVWSLPKSAQGSGKSKPPLGLAVLLRPLTPLLPPRLGSQEEAVTENNTSSMLDSPSTDQPREETQGHVEPEETKVKIVYTNSSKASIKRDCQAILEDKCTFFGNHGGAASADRPTPRKKTQRLVEHDEIKVKIVYTNSSKASIKRDCQAILEDKCTFFGTEGRATSVATPLESEDRTHAPASLEMEQDREGNDTLDSPQVLPPSFIVATFPSSKAAPFIVPFAWAYRISHSVSTGRTAKMNNTKQEFKGTVSAFKTIGRFGSSRLEDRADTIQAILAQLKGGTEPFVATIEKALSKTYGGSKTGQGAKIPISDAFAVFNLLTAKYAEGDQVPRPSPASDDQIGLVDLIRITFPLWKGITLSSTARKTRSVNAWDLDFDDGDQGKIEQVSADAVVPGTDKETGLVYTVDESLRAKIECAIEDFVKETPKASLFSPLLTDDDAPSYSCAVPLGMSFDRILRRLRRRSASREDGIACYYRTTDALLNDLSTISDNCLGYNSPDSEVAELILDMIPTLKKNISQVASRHLKEKESQLKQDEERRNAIFLQCDSAIVVKRETDTTETKPSSRKRPASTARYLHAPFTEKLQRSWIQSTHPDGAWNLRVQSPSVESTDIVTQKSREWMPQSGDYVVYSRELHSQFVQGHYPSLTTEQCSLPKFPARDTDMDTDSSAPSSLLTAGELSEKLEKLLVAQVVWVRSEFPRDPAKKDENAMNTFQTCTPVLAMGIRFPYSWAGPNNLHRVSWRPCILGDDCASSEPVKSTRTSRQRKADESPDDSNVEASPVTCNGCNLTSGASFIRPVWIPLDNGMEGDNTPQVLFPDLIPSQVVASNPAGLASDEVASIDRCMNVLKRRCLGGINPDFVDPKFSMENVKNGWCPASKGVRKLPTFERLLEKGNLSSKDKSTDEESSGRTRGVEHVDEDSIASLADVHFLPPWTSALSGTTGKDQKTNLDGIVKSISSHEMFSPSPNFCLELIQLRLREGYYRQKSALIHDIQEAYVSSVLLALYEPSSRKKGKPLSIRKVSKALASGELLREENAASNVPPVAALPSVSVNSKKGTPKKGSAPKKAAPKKGKKFSEEEAATLKRIARVRRLYATALVCATESELMERIFGSVPKRKPKAIAALPATDSQRDQREQLQRNARDKLVSIISALYRDPSNNRAHTQTVLPDLTLKITGSFGQMPPARPAPALPSSTSTSKTSGTEERVGTPQEKETRDTEALPSRSVTSTPGKVVESHEKQTEDQGDSSSSNKKAEDSVGTQETIEEFEVDLSQPIVFPHIYLHTDDALVSSMFGKEGRKGTCARCNANRRSVFACRVIKKHANTDFDWSEALKGTGGINGLLHTMKTGERPPVETVAITAATASSVLQPAASADNEADPTSDQAASAASASKTEISAKSQPVADSEEISKANPVELLEDAERAVALAESLVKEAREAAARPVRLSEEFITACFPIDPSDNHYNYCIICGYSGDVLCCEGCPNVAHAKCLELQDIPENDWYCKKCTAKSKTRDESTTKDTATEGEDEAGPVEASALSAAADSAVADPTDETQSTKENPVADFDKRTQTLAELLARLKAIRFKPKKNGGKKQRDKSEEENEKVARDNDDAVNSDGESVYQDDESDASMEIDVGTNILKAFDDQGDFTGEVIQMPTKDSRFYLVRYEDGDEEELSETELKKVALRARKASKPKALLKRGRAKRQTDENFDATPQRKRGRPRKDEHVDEEPPKKKSKKFKRKPRRCKRCVSFGGRDAQECQGRWGQHACEYFEEDGTSFDASATERPSKPKPTEGKRTRRCKRCVSCGGNNATICQGRTNLGQSACEYFDEDGTALRDDTPVAETPQNSDQSDDGEPSTGRRRRRPPPRFSDMKDPPRRRRRPPLREDGEDESEDEPPPRQKRQSRGSRSRRASFREYNDDESEEDAPQKPKPGKRTRRCKRCVSFGGSNATICQGRTNLGQSACEYFEEDGAALRDDITAEEAPSAKRQSRDSRGKRSSLREDSEDESEDEQPSRPKRQSRGSRNKRTAAQDESENDASEDEPPPRPKRQSRGTPTRSRKRRTLAPGDSEEDSEDELPRRQSRRSPIGEPPSRRSRGRG